MIQDKWEFLDVNDQPQAVLEEDSLLMGLLRRFLSGLIPQSYDLSVNEQLVAEFKQNFNPFSYRLTMDFSKDSMSQIDRRMGVAAGILLGAIEGRQS